MIMSLLKKNTKYHYDSVTKCDGIYIYKSNGEKLIDTSSGAALCNIGYANPHIMEAFKQIDHSVS